MSEDFLSRLESRRSVPPALLTEPAPGEAELQRILGIAARVPDHAMLTPWRFIVIEGDARAAVSRQLSEHYFGENTAMEPAKREKFTAIMARVFTYAPLVVVLVSKPDTAATIPVSEQLFSAGAVGMNLLNAVHASGYGASWLTGWAAYSPGAREVFAMSEDERVVGFIHIGTPKEVPPDRKRPDVAALTTRWRPPPN
ncbi:nitroreductase [soil metagenome]